MRITYIHVVYIHIHTIVHVHVHCNTGNCMYMYVWMLMCFLFLSVCRMEEERQERQALKMAGELPLDAPDLIPEKKLFKCKHQCEYVYTIYIILLCTHKHLFTVEEHKSGSFDTGDPLTTNLYVGNISPQVRTCGV